MITIQLSTPPGDPPTLARLAWNRLAFGPRPEDLTTLSNFNLADFVDEQLNYEDIDDSACENYVNALSRAAPNGSTVPPLDASLAELKAYVENNSTRYLQRHLWTATYARALLSKRQLYELMVDFWTNHLQTNFQHYAKYWEDHYVIRTHALGNFRDLIEASAKSPSMLDFLSNRYSDGYNPNENYARELLELHTVGSYSYVPGPGYRTHPNYTEEDVQALARILSGWTNYRSPNDEFYFNAGRSWPRHDWTEKRLWLGNDNYFYIPPGGIEQGEQVFDILVEHPSTAYFIAFKLCRRFISDYPDVFCPEAVEAGAQAFMQSHGDIRQTVRAILLHPKFTQSWGQKVKRPFEFFISTLRALGITEMINFLPDNWNALGERRFAQMNELLGQTLFEFSAPTGYPDIALAWWNTGQVFGRWTLANMLVNRYFGEQLHPTNPAPSDTLLNSLLGLPKSATNVVDDLIARFIGRNIHADDRTALIQYLGQGNANANVDSTSPRLRPLIAVIAASPYAQWR
ncbi:MAG: DUF1800 domain-containing protein [Chloroflexi bacterium]|jgi:uncharacterized protein (DUF1800 family)|uniref:DUF1800 domain-containing protein n=1 Tax=Candidatus Roseilinea sp. NK_OTU-006 TaxID=2704250 RepID=UPI000F0F788A|nr:DUF1800 domain-containing protein [Candidatus Roseilinea sp. NK_OTU-006]RMG64065.1 MAG: DUF1800 domain-containing protein [Chloroflexota bacterium]